MKTIAEYLRRIGKARGFGIQSPWAYSFVTEVIGERLPYYAYTEIDRRNRSRKMRKRQRLYYRISNFVHGSRMYVTDITTQPDDIIVQLCRMAADTGVVVIENIYRNRECRRRWETLKQHEAIGITFDLYDFAICFLDRKIMKQHYKLNF